MNNIQITPPTRNIGGGLLCSFGYNTFDLVPLGGHHAAQVVPREEQDTYAALLIRDGQPPLELATHPNGHSCKCLLDRMSKGDDARTLNQFDFILLCGGTTMNRDDFAALLLTLNKKDA